MKHLSYKFSLNNLILCKIQNKKDFYEKYLYYLRRAQLSSLFLLHKNQFDL